MHIYKWTHIASGRCYIGQSVQEPNRRRLEHISNSRYTPKTYHFHNALKKYGVDAFTWEVISTAKSLEELNLLEEQYVRKYNSIINGYNIRQPGANKLHSEESKKRMSEAQKIAHARRRSTNDDKCEKHKKHKKHVFTKPHPNKGKSCANKGKKKGMTWEQIFGEEIAASRREKHALRALSRKSGG